MTDSYRNLFTPGIFFLSHPEVGIKKTGQYVSDSTAK